MNHETAWWEDLFEGHLSYGIDQERIAELEGESFLYFDEHNKTEESLYTHDQ